MKENASPCPSSEELLEFSEVKDNPEIAHHLEHCQKCKKIVAANQMLNQLLEDYSKPSPDFAERIQAACREQRLEDEFLRPTTVSSRKARRLVLYQRFLRVAALFVLLIGVFAMIRQQNATTPRLMKSSDASMTMTEVPADLLPAVQQAPISLPEQTALPVSVASAADGFSMNDNIALGGMHKTLPQELMEVSTQGARPRAVHQKGFSRISDEVTHVWVTDALPSKNDLQNTLGLPDDCMIEGAESPDKNGIFTWTVVASDSTVQHIVDCLYQQHWRLLSPAAPQPNKASFAKANGHSVIYTLKIVAE